MPMSSRVTILSAATCAALLAVLTACSGGDSDPSGDATSTVTSTQEPSPTETATETEPPVVEGTTFSSGGASLVLPDTWEEDSISVEGIHYIVVPGPGAGGAVEEVGLTTILFSSGDLDKAERVLADDSHEEWTRMPDAEFDGKPTLVLEAHDILDRRLVKYAVISDGALQVVTFKIADKRKTSEDERTSAETEEFIASTMSTWRVE